MLLLVIVIILSDSYNNDILELVRMMYISVYRTDKLLAVYIHLPFINHTSAVYPSRSVSRVETLRQST